MEKKTCKVVKEPVKIYLNKKLDPKQNTIQTFNINAQWLKKNKKASMFGARRGIYASSVKKQSCCSAGVKPNTGSQGSSP